MGKKTFKRKGGRDCDEIKYERNQGCAFRNIFCDIGYVGKFRRVFCNFLSNTNA